MSTEIKAHYPTPPLRVEPDMYGMYEVWEQARFGAEGDMGGVTVQVFNSDEWYASYENGERCDWFHVGRSPLVALEAILKSAVKTYMSAVEEL